MTLLWVGTDYYKRKARLFARENAEGRFLTAEFFSDEKWHDIENYTFNYVYILERALLDD